MAYKKFRGDTEVSVITAAAWLHENVQRSSRSWAGLEDLGHGQGS